MFNRNRQTILITKRIISLVIILVMMQHYSILAARQTNCKHHRKRVNSCMALFRDELSKYQQKQRTLDINSLLQLAGQIPTLCRQYQQMIRCLNGVLENCNSPSRRMDKVRRDLVILKNHMASYICKDSTTMLRQQVTTATPPQEAGRAIAIRHFGNKISARKLEFFWMKFQKSKRSHADKQDRKDKNRRRHRKNRRRKNRRKKNKRLTASPLPTTTTTIGRNQIIFEDGGFLVAAPTEILPYNRDPKSTSNTLTESRSSQPHQPTAQDETTQGQVMPDIDYSLVNIDNIQNNSKTFQIINSTIDENRSSNFSTGDDKIKQPGSVVEPTKSENSMTTITQTKNLTKDTKEIVIEEEILFRFSEDVECEQTTSTKCKSRSKQNNTSNSAPFLHHPVVFITLTFLVILERFS